MVATFFSFLARALRFMLRHRWSVPLAALSAWFFAELASELREGELTAFDEVVTSWVVGFRGRLDTAMVLLTSLGSRYCLAPLTIVVMGLLWVSKRPHEAVFLAIACGGAGLFNLLLKLLFRRERPGPAAEYLAHTPESFSFPSGHAMGSMAVFSSLLLVLQVLHLPRSLRALAAVFALSLALGVGLSRIYLGAHFPSDVLAGQLAAAAWVSAVAGYFYPQLLPGEEAERT